MTTTVEPTAYQAIEKALIERLTAAGYRIELRGANGGKVTKPDGTVYLVDDGACTCTAGVWRNPCKHAKAVAAAVPCKVMFSQSCAGVMFRCSHTPPAGEVIEFFQCQVCYRIATAEAVQKRRGEVRVSSF